MVFSRTYGLFSAPEQFSVLQLLVRPSPKTITFQVSDSLVPEFQAITGMKFTHVKVPVWHCGRKVQPIQKITKSRIPAWQLTFHEIHTCGKTAQSGRTIYRMVWQTVFFAKTILYIYIIFVISSNISVSIWICLLCEIYFGICVHIVSPYSSLFLSHGLHVTPQFGGRCL